MGDQKSIQRVYQGLKDFMAENKSWSLFLITSDKSAEEAVMGRLADRRRKLYNGRIEVTYFQFHGEKPKT
jgi:putative N6-adenine-specific DNA methylase